MTNETLNTEFQGTRYRTESDMLLALASEYLSAGGRNDEDTQREVLNSHDDEALADECIKGFGLSEPDPLAYDRTWLEMRDLDRSDIEAAFYDIRARF